MIPSLEPHCGSWVVCHKASGAVIFETFHRHTAERVNQSKYTVETAAQYLGRINQKKKSVRSTEMKTLIVFCAAVALTGCSTIMTDRMQDVHILGAPGTAYTITNEDGQRVAQGTAPDRVKLDAAAGWFDGETYRVNDKELDSNVTPWYWVGFCISVVSGLIVDPLTGDMFELPDEVQL